MHELGIATSLIDSVIKVAKDNKVLKIKKINIIYGASSAIIEEALIAAFESLKELDEYSICLDAHICLHIKKSTSICLDCANKFKHETVIAICPYCNSINTQVIDGKDVYIEDIEVES